MSISSITPAQRGLTGVDAGEARALRVSRSLGRPLRSCSVRRRSPLPLSASRSVPSPSGRSSPWPVLLTGLLLVIFLDPDHGATGCLAACHSTSSPIEIVVLVLTFVWVVALLADRKVRLRRTALDLPIALLYVAVLASVLGQHRLRRQARRRDRCGRGGLFSFFTNFPTRLRDHRHSRRRQVPVERLLRVIVVLTAVVSIFAIVEYHTRYNVFNHLSRRSCRSLEYQGDLDLESLSRGGELPGHASSQRPDRLRSGALGDGVSACALRCSTTPGASGGGRLFLIGLGALSSLSRTGIVAILGAGVALFALRPTETRRLVPLLVPALAVVFLALPNALGHSRVPSSLREGSWVSRRRSTRRTSCMETAALPTSARRWTMAGTAGLRPRLRLADPSRSGRGRTPPFSTTSGLDLLLELGIVGFFAVRVGDFRAVRRLGRIARGDPFGFGLLAGSLAASVVSFAVGIATYDAFGFIQVAFLFFVVLALAASLIALSERGEEPKAATQ